MTTSRIDLDIRVKVQDLGLSTPLFSSSELALPITVTLDFEGQNMPGDTTVDVVALSGGPDFDGSAIVVVEFDGLDTEAAAGTLSLTAVDANSKPSKDNAVVSDVSVVGSA